MAEYEEVLARRKFKFSQKDVNELLGFIRKNGIHALCIESLVIAS